MNTTDAIRAALTILVIAAAFAPEVEASYAFYVGKNLTENGVVMVGGAGEEVSSHWLEIVPRRRHPPGATLKVGVTERATSPGN